MAHRTRYTMGLTPSRSTEYSNATDGPSEVTSSATQDESEKPKIVFLFVSPLSKAWDSETHVGRVLGKLGIMDLAKVAIYESELSDFSILRKIQASIKATIEETYPVDETNIQNTFVHSDIPDTLENTSQQSSGNSEHTAEKAEAASRHVLLNSIAKDLRALTDSAFLLATSLESLMESDGKHKTSDPPSENQEERGAEQTPGPSRNRLQVFCSAIRAWIPEYEQTVAGLRFIMFCVILGTVTAPAFLMTMWVIEKFQKWNGGIA